MMKFVVLLVAFLASSALALPAQSASKDPQASPMQDGDVGFGPEMVPGAEDPATSYSSFIYQPAYRPVYRPVYRPSYGYYGVYGYPSYVYNPYGYYYGSYYY